MRTDFQRRPNRLRSEGLQAGRILALALGLFVGFDLQAGIIKKAQVGFRFLENPISAEAVGRGGLGLVMFRNANTVFWNPAGLGWINTRLDVAANYTRGIADINHGSFAAAVDLGGSRVVAFDGLTIDYGDFYGTRRADNDEGYVDTEVFSPQAFALGLSFGQRVSDRFSYGVRVKYVMQDLGDAWITVDKAEGLTDTTTKNYALAEPALDLGAIYDFQFHGIRFGAAIQNYSRRISFETQEIPLPFAISFSIMVDPLSIVRPDLGDHVLHLGLETRHPRDFKEKVKLGAEYAFRDMFIVRGGFMGNYDQRGLTLGFGFKQAWTAGTIRFDYAYQDFGIFQAVHIVSFGIAR
ncbi:MAG: PorV/PorQ family protein [Candidatus Neomarinimicrobiota bacterium]